MFGKGYLPLAGVAILIMLLLPPVHASDDAGGTSRFDPALNGPSDSVNLRNLGVTISIPFPSVRGRGVDLDFALSYNSLLWSLQNGKWKPIAAPETDSEFGWATQSPVEGKIHASIDATTCLAPDLTVCPGPGLCPTCNTADQSGCKEVTQIRYHSWRYTTPRGTSITFPDVEYRLFGVTCVVDKLPTGGTRAGLAGDGSGYYLDAWSPLAPLVYTNEGQQYELSGLISDSNGNYISKERLDARTVEYVDTKGIPALSVIDDSAEVIRYLIATSDEGGGPPSPEYSEVTLSRRAFRVRTAFACPGVQDYVDDTQVQLPTQILLPDGATYEFQYEQTPGAPAGYTTGRIAQLTLPTGAIVEYSYPTSAPFGIDCSTGAGTSLIRTVRYQDPREGAREDAWVMSRTGTLADFVVSLSAPEVSYDAAASPMSVYRYQNGALTEERHAPVSNPSQVLQETRYVVNSRGWPLQRDHYFGAALSTTPRKRTEWTYDERGNVLTEIDYEISNLASPVPFRTIVREYESSPSYLDRNLGGLVREYSLHQGGPTGPRIRAASYRYDESGALLCVAATPPHHSMECSDPVRGNLTSVTRYTQPGTRTEGLTRTFNYDEFGNIVRTESETGQVTTWEFDSSTEYAFPSRTIDGPSTASPMITHWSWQLAAGRLRDETNPNAETTEYQYRWNGELERVEQPGNRVTEIQYDVATKTNTVTDPTGVETIAKLDELGRIYRREIRGSDPSDVPLVIAETQFDALGRKWRELTARVATEEYWSETRYDALGRQTQAIPFVDASLFNRTLTSYNGVEIIRTDADGRATKFRIGGAGWISDEISPDPYSGNALVDGTRFEYSADGQPSRIRFYRADTGVFDLRQRTWTYDGLGRLQSQFTPDRGLWSYAYDADGRITSWTDARAVIGRVNRDEHGRAWKIEYDSTAAPGVIVSPDQVLTYGSSAADHAMGRLVSIASGSGSDLTKIDYAYDHRGFVSTVAQTVDSVLSLLSLTVDDAGRLFSLVYPSGAVATYTRNTLGEVESLDVDGFAVLPVIERNSARKITSLSFGNSINEELLYVPETADLERITLTRAGSALFDLGFNYDVFASYTGQISATIDHVQPGRSQSFTYDSLGRIATAGTAGDPTFGSWLLEYEFDRFGNRLVQRALVAQPNEDWPYTPTNYTSFPRDSDRGQPSDAIGDRTLIGNHYLTYDARGQLRRREGRWTHFSSDVLYTNDGRVTALRGGDVNRTLIHGPSGEVIAEYEDGVLSAEHFYLGTRRIATRSGGTWVYFHKDQLSVRVTTNDSAQVVGEFGHYPFGDEWYSFGTLTQRFTDYDRDELTEGRFDDAGFRWYDVEYGRFLSPDPIRSSVNAYSYANNDPINQLDPNGLYPQHPDFFISGVTREAIHPFMAAEPRDSFTGETWKQRYGVAEPNAFLGFKDYGPPSETRSAAIKRAIEDARAGARSGPEPIGLEYPILAEFANMVPDSGVGHLGQPWLGVVWSVLPRY